MLLYCYPSVVLIAETLAQVTNASVLFVNIDVTKKIYYTNTDNFLKTIMNMEKNVPCLLQGAKYTSPRLSGDLSSSLMYMSNNRSKIFNPCRSWQRNIHGTSLFFPHCHWLELLVLEGVEPLYNSVLNSQP